MDATAYWGWSAESGAGLLPRNWDLFVLRGMLTLAIGMIAMVPPASALSDLTLIFVAFAFADGISSIVAGVRGAHDRYDRWWELILRGVVGVIVGALFLLAPTLTIISYAVASLALLSIWAIGTGLFEIAAAVRLRREIRDEWLMMLSGILSILLAIAAPMILLFYPSAASQSVGVLLGIYALAAGLVLMALGLKLRGRQRQRLPL